MAKKDYPFVGPYCRYMGSYDYYRDAEIERLRATDAPADAYATKHGGGCYRVSEIPNRRLADMLEQAAGVTAAEVLAR